MINNDDLAGRPQNWHRRELCTSQHAPSQNAGEREDAPGPSTFVDRRSRSTFRLTRRTCTSASTTASTTTAPTAPPTIATRCGVDAARAGDGVVLLLLLATKDRTCAFREDQALRAQRLVGEPLSRAATSERERKGDGAAIACGGAG